MSATENNHDQPGGFKMSIFRKITESVTRGVSTATEKAQQTVEMTRLSVQVAAKHKDIERLFTQMGEAVYQGYLAKNLAQAEPKIFPACREIEKLYAEIARLEDRLMALRNEKECVCGQKVTYDARYCPACGHPFPIPAVAVDNAVPQQSETAITQENKPLPEPVLTADQSAQAEIAHQPAASQTSTPSGGSHQSDASQTTTPSGGSHQSDTSHQSS